jgi:putative CocE/NonD family hydrolase
MTIKWPLTLLLTFFLFITLYAQDENYVRDHYNKQETYITMRDGTRLFTAIYSPKDQSRDYPILLLRTPYSCRPYGEDRFRSRIGPNPYMMEEGYIVVYQDVRGRWMSEGVYDNMRAYIPNKSGEQFDEASDTYDTIDWLVKNVNNNNGNVGVWGISYPGFYATYSLLDAHPALKAVSPQATIGDFFFDDFHHNGAYLLSYWLATTVFGYEKTRPVSESWYEFPQIGTQDQYQFYLDHTPLSKLDKYYGEDNVFWQQLKDHPNYDTFWQSRGIIQHLSDVKPAVMFVGGLFDAEDLYGPFAAYRAVENHSDTYNTLVFGPWSHGGWSRERGRQAVGNIYFGDSISTHYQKEVEAVFFRHFLKGPADGVSGLPEAYVFDTGQKEWRSFSEWPPAGVKQKRFWLQSGQRLNQRAEKSYTFESFVSDPKKPVPYTEDIKVVFTPRKYMTDDQRFAARRPNVLVFETPPLTQDITLSGEVLANLFVSTTGTDADWVVKLIDVFPSDTKDTEEVQDHLKLSNYHMMVRSEVMRGRFRESFSDPKPFVPGEKTSVKIKLQDVLHTFKKGHRIQIQVQSSWFPLIDMNPQTFVPNIFKASEEDFTKQEHRVYNDSFIEFQVLE